MELLNLIWILPLAFILFVIVFYVLYFVVMAIFGLLVLWVGHIIEARDDRKWRTQPCELETPHQKHTWLKTFKYSPTGVPEKMNCPGVKAR